MIQHRIKGIAKSMSCGEMRRIEVGGSVICLIRTELGDYHAVSDACSHEPDASLSDGWAEGCEVECPRHNSIFDVRTGAALSLPATEPLQVYPVAIEGHDILIAIGADTKSE